MAGPAPDADARAPAGRSPWRAVADHPWWTALAVLVLAIVVLVLAWDWNWFKGPVERRVRAETGRSFEIGGDLDVDLGWVPTIRAERLRFGNASWSKTPTMAKADRLEFDVQLKPLLFEIGVEFLRFQAHVVIFECILERSLNVIDHFAGKDQPHKNSDHQGDCGLDQRPAELLEVLAEGHLGAFEQVFVVLAVHGGALAE